MKIKLQEKLIALLLVFAIAFLTVPLAKADIIISLEENEETTSVALNINDAIEELALASSYTFTYWYTNTSVIGYWYFTPCVYYTKLDGSDNFKTGMQNAVSQWSSALGITIRSSHQNVNQNINSSEDFIETTFPLHFYGGTPDELEDLGIFTDSKIWDNTTLGETYYKSYNSYPDVIYANGSYRTYWRLLNVRGYVKNTNSQTTHYNVCAHELGHALGWHGHSSNASDLMYTYSNSKTGPQTRDILHLKQIYDLLFYR